MKPKNVTRSQLVDLIRWGTVLAALGTGAVGALVGADLPKPTPASREAIRNWQDQRFGMFIHWGPVSLTGHEIGWSRGKETPIEVYDNLYKRFNPTNFNAGAWAKIAKDAGMKYIVFTTKHHDGFCMWDTKQTDFNIMHSPFGRDVVKELVAACKKEGVAFGTYYSVCDWHHPDFPLGSPGGKTQKPNPNMDRYTEYLRAQVTELIKNYGPLVEMWFDVPQETGPDRGIPTANLVRSLQPDILINNRVYRAAEQTGAAGGQDAVGDYSTPEQKIGGFNLERPWESCMTISAHNHWAWGGENDGVKPLATCLRMLISGAGGDGNILLNVGPRPDGMIDPEQAARLKEMGGWLAKYGESIYGTRGGPFKPGKWGASTRKNNRIYIHAFKWARDALELPAIPARITAAKVLTGGSVEFKQTDAGLTFRVPAANQDAIDTLIALDIDKPAMELAPVNAVSRSASLATGAKATASNVHQKNRQYGAEKAVDDDMETRWATDAGTKQAWLQLDLGGAKTFSKVAIHEWAGGGKRIQKFELQSQDGDGWKTIFAGATVGEEFTKEFPAVTARVVRLNILDASNGPTIDEFEIFK